MEVDGGKKNQCGCRVEEINTQDRIGTGLQRNLTFNDHVSRSFLNRD